MKSTMTLLSHFLGKCFISILAIILLLILLPLTSSNQTSCWAQAQRSPLHFQVMNDESYGESVTAIALVGEGEYVLLQAMITNAGIGDEKGVCRILYIPKGKAGVNEVNRDGDDWSYAHVTQTLKIASCEIIASKTATLFKANTESMSAHLLFKRTIKKIKPPHATVKVKSDESFTADLLIPWSEVIFKIKTKQSKTQKKMKGHGYLDHGRSNTLLPKVAKSWFRFRGFQGKTPVLFEFREGVKTKDRAWIYANTDKTPQALNGKVMNSWKIDTSAKGVLKTKSGSKKVALPQASMQLPQGILIMKATDVLYHYEPAKAYGLLGSLAKNWVGDPITQTYVGEITWPGGSAKGVIEHILIRK
jgi:hypothetical protein